MQIAVTGGSGRLGRYVLRALDAGSGGGHEPRVLDVVPPGDRRVDFRMRTCAISRRCRRRCAEFEVVVHLGGIDRSVATDDSATMQVNTIGTWNLFEASRCAGVRRVIHCSSSSVTGIDQSNPAMPPCYLPIDEAHALRPTDAYGLGKLCGEQIAAAYARRGMEVLVLRPCFVAFPELADFMAGRGGPGPLSTAGRTEPMPFLRAYVGPEDCARGFAAAVALQDYRGHETFFLAAADAFATEPTVARLEALYGAQMTLRDAALYRQFPMASPVSSARAGARLGWTATTRWSGDRIVSPRTMI